MNACVCRPKARWLTARPGPQIFFVVCSRNRLEILENPDNPVPDQWYKDEGGRENCVELQVSYARKKVFEDCRVMFYCYTYRLP